MHVVRVRGCALPLCHLPLLALFQCFHSSKSIKFSDFQNRYFAISTSSERISAFFKFGNSTTVHIRKCLQNTMSIERNEGVVVVIDPYSSGRFLVEELHRRGKKIVSLRSTLDVTACLLEGYDADAYHGSYDVPADEPPAQTAEYLTQTYGKIEAVFAG
jgi:hypothetical protein